MTKQKSFKGRVRARMGKTSESYTAARRQLLAKATAEAEAPEGVAVPADPAGTVAPETADVPGAKRPYSDAVIEANTGKRWDEWFAVLDRWGAVERPHGEIARWVGEEHGVGGWWAQGVTVAYEQARGLRAPGQRRGGLFEVNASKTVAVPVERLYEAFIDPGLRERWLPGATMEVRSARPGRSIRANWDDGSTRLVIDFTAKGEAKSQVALVHERIADAATAGELKAWWRGRVAALKQLLET
jgi:uncharacterized protein YndB with AHSA1/START domain